MPPVSELTQSALSGLPGTTCVCSSHRDGILRSVPKLAIIHTTIATVQPLKALTEEIIPRCVIMNFVDDSILPQLAERGTLAAVEERLVSYARFAEAAGADVVLEACSSVGEIVPKAQKEIGIPIVRIDEPMAEMAVGRGQTIGVVATLRTTLEPTLRLVKTKAEALGKEITISPVLVADAYEKLIAGNQALHDERLVDALAAVSESVDVIVLAQASMARVLRELPDPIAEKCLASPRLAIGQVKHILDGRP